MRLLEYEAKELLRQFTIPTPRAFLVDGNKPDFLPAVVKSQVPIGGRGKAGGIAIATTPTEFSQAAKRIKKLSISGFTPVALLAEEAIAIEHEYYLSLVVNRQKQNIELIAHSSGGVEVEGNKTGFLRIELTGKNADVAGEQLADFFNLPEKSFVLKDLIEHLYDCFTKTDALLLEINPLVLTKQGSLVAADCKMQLDSAAAFRHKDWNFEAKEIDTNFVTLDHNGTVATIANGAGLAMATVDAVANAGLQPANFLDIGGGANEASALAAFKRIMEYPNVQVIVINIFAGITRCDEIARAIIAAKAHIPNLPPLTIRLAGTNVEQAITILEAESIPILPTLEACVASAKEHAA